MSTNKKILVTGGSGMVGQYLKELMPDAIYVSSTQCNLMKQEAVENMFYRIKPDVVIHLAARVGGISSNLVHPAEYFDENILMNTLVLRESHKSGVKQFIGILSTCIYPDKCSVYPMLETNLHDGPPTPTNFSYGYAKRSLAVQIDAYNKEYGTNYSYLIPSNLYGEYDKYDVESSHFVSALIKKIHEAKKQGSDKITLMGTGAPLRQFFYAKDFATVIKKCVDENITENFNIACNDNLTIKQIAEIALKACDAEHLLIEFDTTKPDGQFRKDVSNAKMMSIMPDFVFTGLEEGIRISYQRAIELNKF